MKKRERCKVLIGGNRLKTIKGLRKRGSSILYGEQTVNGKVCFTAIAKL